MLHNGIKFVDIDNVISADAWRIPHIDFSLSGDRRYHDYHLLSAFDLYVPLPPKLSNAQHTIVFVTAMPEQYRALRMMWLDTKRVRYHSLLMRPEGDHRHSSGVKRDLVQEFMSINQLSTYDIAAAIDDREEVVAMYRNIGLPGVHHKLYDVNYDDPHLFKEAV